MFRKINKIYARKGNVKKSIYYFTLARKAKKNFKNKLL